MEPFQLTYTKPTDTHQYLHMNSCHPNHVKKAIAFLQVTRISSICSDPATAQSRCNELIEYLVCCGHGQRHTQLEVQRAIDAYRNPQQHIRNIDRIVYFTVQYHPRLPDIKGTSKNFFAYPLHFRTHENGVFPPSSCFVLPTKKPFSTIMSGQTSGASE